MENLNAWLDWIKSISIKQIDLSLDRVKEVLSRLNYSTQSIVIIVAGTNGKGSTVKVLEEIYQESGFSVGAFTSPYLHKYNEQIRINGMSCEDDKICSAF
ncbi:MAG TPA: bifunctional folylpolyglutamate synthase/dihydrofolate synthase, partial [Gammaproteobacteria bacterium]|nr:bifunctional folylpolyglutamate synthase/dihydrofolate synthase [Gammaproteobacteria bacterium]